MWQAALIGAIGGMMQGMGQNKAAKAQNQFNRWLYNPSRVAGAVSQLNPGAYQASQQQGYKQAWNAIGQNPGYIDPSLQSYAFMQNDKGWQQALQRLGSQIGRSGMTGGMGQAHTLAAYGGQAMGRARIAQQFALWREQQRRGDLQMIANQNSQSQATAAGLAANQGNAYVQPTPWQSTAGNAIQGFNANIMPYLMQYWQQGQQTPTGGGPGVPIGGGGRAM